jgi:hypothetical protein
MKATSLFRGGGGGGGGGCWSWEEPVWTPESFFWSKYVLQALTLRFGLVLVMSHKYFFNLEDKKVFKLQPVYFLL